MAWLEIENLEAFFHRIGVLHKVSLRVEKGDLIAVIGSNGAGKTTLLKSISRLVPTRGKIWFRGEDMTPLKPHQVIKKGVVHCPEGRLLFPNMSISKNLMMGAYLRRDPQGVTHDLERVFQLLPVLSVRKKQLAGTLSGGEQQMLALGRALMGRPKLLILDEPSFGLAPIVVNSVFEVIQKLSEEGLSILLVEQNAMLALEAAKFVYVLEEGKIVKQGKSKELINDPLIKEAYLGTA
ncbi:MAG: ABC transporter ATP-binding protein [Deltaproteobacteria bacterium]|nr:ABC transporter ATP-binding protein [Deltaproteobacteria bacterium]